MTGSRLLSQIELGNTMPTEPVAQDAIRRRRLHPHGVPSEGLRDPQGAPPEIEPPAQLDATHGHPTGVRDGRERGREAAQAMIGGGLYLWFARAGLSITGAPLSVDGTNSAWAVVDYMYRAVAGI